MRRSRLSQKGFTLVEVLIAFILLGIVVGALLNYFLSNQGVYNTQDLLNEMTQTLEISSNLLGREARAAGLNVKLNSPGTMTSSFLAFVPSGFYSGSPLTVSLSTSDYPLKVTSGGTSTPDVITIVGLQYDNISPTSLASNYTSPSATIALNLTAAQTSSGFSVGDIIYIGPGDSREYAQVKTVSSSKQLSIDADPLTNGTQGFANSYTQGTEVGKISVVTYAVITNQLMRKQNGGSFQPIADNIVNMKISQSVTTSGNQTTIRLTARASKADPTCKTNGGYRQKTHSIQVTAPNIH
jgi:prepilin-type N-terminal cleavage/methylation domain-containing protein